MPIGPRNEKDDFKVKCDDGTFSGALVGCDGAGTALTVYEAAPCCDRNEQQHRWGSNLRYTDMGTATGGVARGTSISTSWTTLYSVTGSGIFAGFVLALQDANKGWLVRLTIDGNEIFNGTTGILLSDFHDNNIYGFRFNEDRPNRGIGFDVFASSLVFDDKITYQSSIVIRARKTDGAKAFLGGLIRRSI